MKTITYILTLAILMMFASPILAAQNEPTTVNPMYRQMEKMQLQIKEVKATKEPEKRKMLMQQHMQSMREGMMMMDETSYANDMMMRETGYTNGMMMGETDDAHGMMMGEAQSKVVHQRMQENQERTPLSTKRYSLPTHSNHGTSSGKHAGAHENDANDNATDDGTSVCAD